MDTKERKLLEFVTEMGIGIALMTILLYIGAEIPVGTSAGVLNLGMIVIIFISIRRGILAGAILGIVMGLEHSCMGKGYVLSPSHPVLGLTLDYFTQYMSLSLGVIWLYIFKLSKTKKNWQNTTIITLVITTSFICALTNESISGMVAWSNGTRGWVLIGYVIVANYPYLLATYILTLIGLIPLMNIAIKSDLYFMLPIKYLNFQAKNNLNENLAKINIDKSNE